MGRTSGFEALGSQRSRGLHPNNKVK